jgi:hypothetical protein
MDYEKIKRTQSLGGESTSGRQSKRPKHEKGAEKKISAFKSEISVLGLEKEKLIKQEDKYRLAKLEFMANSKKADARAQEQKDFFEKNQNSSGNFKMKVKSSSMQIDDAEKDLSHVESHITKQKTKIQNMTSAIVPEAGQRMIKGLSHFVHQYNINKNEFGDILKTLASKDVLTAIDFKKLNEINATVIEAKADAPQVQEALRSGSKFALTSETMDMLADEAFNVAVEPEIEIVEDIVTETAYESRLGDEFVSIRDMVPEKKPLTEKMNGLFEKAKLSLNNGVKKLQGSLQKPVDTELTSETSKEESIVETEVILNELFDESVIPSNLEEKLQNEQKPKKSFISQAKLGLNRSITKLQTRVSKQYEKYIGIPLESKAMMNETLEQKEPALDLDENHEIILDEIPHLQQEDITLNTVLQGQHSKIHTLEMEQDGVTMTASIHMSDDLLSADMYHHEEGEYLDQHPDSIETLNESFYQVAKQLAQRLHPSNLRKDDASEKLLNERQEPTIQMIDDDLTDIQNARHEPNFGELGEVTLDLDDELLRNER